LAIPYNLTGNIIKLLYEIREELARKHDATICCPITTGIFAWIAANAAEEAAAEGKKNITPYRRTLKTGGVIYTGLYYPRGCPGRMACKR
jgi:hypothetical protein